MKRKDFVKDVKNFLEHKPKSWRDGQAVFNYIDQQYGVASEVQPVKGIDCFFNDDMIDNFIEAAYDIITKNDVHDFPGSNMVEE